MSLTRLEIQEQEAYDRGITVEYLAPGDERLRGLPSAAAWRRRKICIYISRRLKNSEKLELLLHERGHIETHNGGFGCPEARRELLAWEWAYRHYIDADELGDVCEDYKNDYDCIAEHYDVTPRFIIGACHYYSIVAPYLEEDAAPEEAAAPALINAQK